MQTSDGTPRTSSGSGQNSRRDSDRRYGSSSDRTTSRNKNNAPASTIATGGVRTDARAMFLSVAVSTRTRGSFSPYRTIRIRSDSFKFVHRTPPRKTEKRIRERLRPNRGKTVAADFRSVCNGARPASAPPVLPAMRPYGPFALLTIICAAAQLPAQPPRRPGAPHLTTAEVKTAEHVYKHTPQGDLKLHFYLPTTWKAADKRPAIVFFFGGGWRNGSHL